MRRWLAGALALACFGFIGNDSANPNPLTFWWYAGDPAVLAPALECALARIRAATCLPVDVSFDAHHWVRQLPAADMGGRSGWTTGAWAGTRIKLSEALAADQVCPVLIHEIVHVLRRSNAHPGPDGSMTFPVVHVHSAPVTRLVAYDLDAICAAQQCECFNPEP